MKPLLFKVPTVDDRSFRVQVDDGPHFYDRLHFHPELQLTLIKESVGTQVVGDRIDRFRPYDLLLLGANLPHVFRNDPDYFTTATTHRALSYSVYLRPEHLKETFFGMPELTHLTELFQEARHGVRIRFNEPVSTTSFMEQLHTLRPFEQLMTLLTVLDRMASDSRREMLSMTAYEQPRRPDDHQRLDSVFTFILNHYASPITLDDVAAQAHLTPSAFCRFFRLHTRKTFSQLLNEVRIEHACRLLQESKLPISQIAFSCGYTNLSNFNRQFKLITGLTPGQYIKAIF
ncbi:AraC family transcriptional regulator [Larkinella knui]|uniref:AraC family transcriptional regulator n=1 Tax=Larkinella knui TaxID=2025310 RepID=A0A3P1CTR9_9BACT|nr:AraC family transcriptional regulator [Larkinella knui]RRB16717.1 AraC family transcriptional regulator [Larkinella knui]